jgi:hypothetical protein
VWRRVVTNSEKLQKLWRVRKIAKLWRQMNSVQAGNFLESPEKTAKETTKLTHPLVGVTLLKVTN